MTKYTVWTDDSRYCKNSNQNCLECSLGSAISRLETISECGVPAAVKSLEEGGIPQVIIYEPKNKELVKQRKMAAIQAVFDFIVEFPGSSSLKIASHVGWTFQKVNIYLRYLLRESRIRSELKRERVQYSTSNSKTVNRHIYYELNEGTANAN